MILSRAAKAPKAWRPSLPVTLAPHVGSATVRENTRVKGADRDGAVDVDAAIWLLAHADDGDVVLVFDVADDLFENVFEREPAAIKALGAGV